MQDLKDKTVVITGAGSGIGQAISLAFAETGAKIVLIGRTGSSLEETKELACAVASPSGLSLGVDLWICDVADRSAVDQVMAKVIDDNGSIDFLINNAGMNTSPRSVGEVEPEDWDRTVSVNLTGPFNCVRSVLPGMRQRKGGTIINIASTAGLRTSEFAGAAYSAAKHGVVSLTYSINEEEADHGIRAAAICPGETDTPIMDDRPNPPSPERRKVMLRPEDVAEAAIFIAKLPPTACVPLLVIKPLYQQFG